MDLLMLGINGLLLMAIWKFGLKKSILDEHRDQLFDLRDELRAEFIARGWSLDSQIYRRLRDQINGYLRFTERYSFFEVMLREREIRGNESFRIALKAQNDAKFATTDTEQAKFIWDFRLRAVNVMMNYMIVSSGPLVILTVFLVPFVLAHLVIKTVLSVVRAGSLTILSTMGEVRGLVEAVLALAAAVIAKELLIKDFVEKWSYEEAAAKHV